MPPRRPNGRRLFLRSAERAEKRRSARDSKERLDKQLWRAMQLSVLNLCRPQACHVRRVIPELDIWRAATLMLKRYGDKALEQSHQRADEMAITRPTLTLKERCAVAA